MTAPTAAERAWIKRVQQVLSECPSKRLGFFTIGDPGVIIYDRSKESKINDLLDSGRARDFCVAVERLDAKIDEIDFPAPVHSTAG